ncbi:MAG TPA: hypothetical protein VF657_11275 [Actinoplanes sp.]
MTDQIRRSYRDDGMSIAALAREHGVSRVAIRTAIADLLPNQPEQPAPAAAAVQAVRVEIPGKVASYLADQPDLGEAEQHALRRGRTVRRGQGFSLHVTALPEVHQALLTAASPLGADGGSSADRKAYRIYHDRLRLAATVAALPAADRPYRQTSPSTTPPERAGHVVTARPGRRCLTGPRVASVPCDARCGARVYLYRTRPPSCGAYLSTVVKSRFATLEGPSSISRCRGVARRAPAPGRRVPAPAR